MTSDYAIRQRSFSSGVVRLLLLILLLGNLLAWRQWVKPGALFDEPRRFSPDLRVTVLDVGQGASVLIETPRGRRFLVDAGPWERDRRNESSPAHLALQKRSIDHLDGLLLTHFHNDRIEGAQAVVEHCRVDRVWENGSTPDTPAFQDYRSICARRRVPRLTVKAGDTLDFGPEVFAAILHPPSEWLKAKKIEQHDGSVVLFLRYGKTGFLLPGDAESEVQQRLGLLGGQIRSTGLLMPMSGSQDAYVESLMRVIQPSFACISVGSGNVAGFPETAVLEELKKEKIAVYRTDLHGDISVRLGGRNETDFQVQVDRSL